MLAENISFNFANTTSSRSHSLSCRQRSCQQHVHIRYDRTIEHSEYIAASLCELEAHVHCRSEMIDRTAVPERMNESATHEAEKKSEKVALRTGRRRATAYFIFTSLCRGDK